MRERPRRPRPPRSSSRRGRSRSRARSRATWRPRCRWCSMHRSELTVDLGAIRRNARTLLRALDGSQLWAVVKADAYGHGAVDVAGAVLDEGAGALCVATVAEGLELRGEFSLIRILVMGPTASSREIAEAREAKLELAVWDEEIPEGG